MDDGNSISSRLRFRVAHSPPKLYPSETQRFSTEYVSVYLYLRQHKQTEKAGKEKNNHTTNSNIQQPHNRRTEEEARRNKREEESKKNPAPI
jgi:hypothetical protein